MRKGTVRRNLATHLGVRLAGDAPSTPPPPIGVPDSLWQYCVTCGAAGHGRRVTCVRTLPPVVASVPMRRLGRKAAWQVAAADASQYQPGGVAALHGGSVAMARPADSVAAGRAVESLAAAIWRDNRNVRRLAKGY